MTFRTRFTDYFAVRHPIALAPMGFSAQAHLPDSPYTASGPAAGA